MCLHAPPIKISSEFSSKRQNLTKVEAPCSCLSLYRKKMQEGCGIEVHDP